ncbi:MAG: hypothetical protein R2689_04295 [Microthrixaceae bacterium]
MSFDYDALAVSVTNPEGETWTQSCNAAGLGWVSTDPAYVPPMLGGTPHPTADRYDTAGRRSSQTIGSATTNYTYNPLGQTATITRANNGTTITKENRAYNSGGLLHRVTTTGPSDSFLRYVKYDWDINQPIPQIVSLLDGSSNNAPVHGPAGIVASAKGNTPTVFATGRARIHHQQHRTKLRQRNQLRPVG